MEQTLPLRNRAARLLVYATIAFFVLLLAAGAALTLLSRAYTDRHAYIVERGQQVALTAGPGERIQIQITVKGTIDHLWSSSTGLHLRFTDRDPVLLQGPAPQRWGDTLSVPLNKPESTLVGGSFVVPDTGGQRAVLSAAVEGTVTYPSPGPGHFDVESIDLHVPVQITADPDSAESIWASWSRIALLQWVCFGLAACIWACALIALLGTIRSVKPSIGDFGTSVFVSLWVGGLVFAAVFYPISLVWPGITIVDPQLALPDTAYLAPALLAITAATLWVRYAVSQ